MPGSNPYTAFFVSALTSDIDVFYSSNVDSAYSVDNLAPAPPAQFTAAAVAGLVELRWSSAQEADFDRFRLYRGADALFVPGPENLVAVLTDTTFVDAVTAGEGCYKLAAWTPTTTRVRRRPSSWKDPR